MSWGTLTLGTLTLGENHAVDDRVNAGDGRRTTVIAGTEFTFGKWTLDQLRAKAEDLVLLVGRVLPVTFSRKSNRNAYYYVTDAGVAETYWKDEGSFFTWNLTLELIGPDNVVSIESRMTHVARANAFGLAGTRWHAPAVGATGYTVGVGAVPTPVLRESTEGTISAYVGIPEVNPAWSCQVESYMGGRARVIVDGIERLGSRIKAGPATWELNNGLIKVSYQNVSGGAIRVSSWDSVAGEWRDKDWGVFYATSAQVSFWHHMTVLRNTPESVAIRLTRGLNPGGVVYLDLILRRGSRFVEGYMQRSTSNELGVGLLNAEAFTDNSASGYIVASSPDGNGQKFVAGSAQSFTAHANGGVVKAATHTLDFFLGVEVAGATTGDLAVDLRNQYIAAPLETTGVVVR